MLKVCKLARQMCALNCGNCAPQCTSEILLVASFPFTLLKNIESFEITDNYRDYNFRYDIRYIVLSLVVSDLV